MSLDKKIKENIVNHIPYDIENKEVREEVEVALDNILDRYKHLIKLHETILNNENLLNDFKDLIVKEIKKGDTDV